MNFKKTFLPLINPLSKDNPVIVQVLGICSALAVTAKMEPALVMTISVTAVLALANVIISLLRMKSAMVFVNAQNLFTITDFYQGFDPEVAYSGSGDGVELGAVAYNYPQVKVVTMGVELKF